MFTQVDHKFPFLESIEKHLFDDHFELHDPNNYQTPDTYPSYNDNGWSFLENSEESSVNMEDISIVFNDLSSSQSSESSPSYSCEIFPLVFDDLDELLINPDDLYKIHSILDDNSDQFLPLSDSTTSTSSIDSTPHIYSNTNIEVSGEFLGMSKDIQPDSVAPIVANHSANSDSTKGAIKNPLKWDFSTGNVSPICKEAISCQKDSLTMACVSAQAPQLPFRHDKSYRGIRRQPRGKYTAEMRNPEKKGSILWLGTYETPEEAAMAYDRAAFKYRGSNALLNFPHLIASHNETPEKYFTKNRHSATPKSSSSSSLSSESSIKRNRK